jgi:hypothetical protein
LVAVVVGDGLRVELQPGDALHERDGRDGEDTYFASTVGRK